MFHPILKALLSGVIIALASEAAKRSPALGGLIVSLPLVSLLAFIWVWVDTGSNETVADISQSTFWFVLPSLPLFLLLPALLRQGLGFWSSLGAACIVTVLLYVATVWGLGRLGML